MGMTIDACIQKLDYSIGAYQKLINENVSNGEIVGTGIRGTWTASTPLNKAYSDMIEALRISKDIISKYRQIEQIANDKNINGDLLRMSEIRWVLEDGNNY